MQAPIDVPRWRFWAIFVALMLAIFLFALDQLIIATAIPKISDQFQSLSELPWLTSGFLYVSNLLEMSENTDQEASPS